MMNSVLKIKTYERNSIDGNYVFSHYGSAVLIDSKRIITNAHVILDADNKAPTGYYEICRTEKNKKVPTCFTTGKLISYDTIADLAVLELANPLVWTKWVILADKKELPVATSVIVYGYPAIGGASITRTEWKIGWISDLTYKFDGTIDHGNSGGGAFTTDGKLIGIPYAVKSDNGSIGYIIPVSQVIEFLAGKTDNIEKFTTKIQSTFVPYIKNIQLLYKNPNLLKTKYMELKNMEKNWFTLANAISSISGDMFMYYFFDKNKRVLFTVNCSKDASVTWKDSISYTQDLIVSQKNMKDSKASIMGGYTDSINTVFSTEFVDIKDTKWSRWAITNIVYKNAPTCSTAVYSGDGKNKDKTSYEKALWLMKSIKFGNTTSIVDNFNSSFFSLKSLPKNIYLDDAIGIDWSFRPNIAILFPSKNIIFSTFATLKFDDVDGYMNYEYGEDNEYSGKGYGFDDFFARFRTSGSDTVTDQVLTSKNGKKLVVTIRNYSDTSLAASKFEKQVRFFYPFVTPEGEYRAYTIDFTVKTEDMDVYQVIHMIEALELPGKSPFND